MGQSVLNFGSLNIDRVFRVPRIARPGETIASRFVSEFAGGKGANQSVALARAGAEVTHLGKIGADGRWLLDKLAAEGIDTRWIGVGDGPTGMAIIQVDDAGQNAIVLSAGANHAITPAEIEEALDSRSAGSWLLVQNETSEVEHAIGAAHALGLKIAFNPAPCDARVPHYPLELVDLLCVNEHEGTALTGETSPEQILASLAARLPNCEILLTLGEAGAIHVFQRQQIRQAARAVDAVDTTAAGDTFLGFYLASRCRGESAADALQLASRAASLCVVKAGAMDSIPTLAEASGAAR